MDGKIAIGVAEAMVLGRKIAKEVAETMVLGRLFAIILFGCSKTNMFLRIRTLKKPQKVL